MDADCFDHKNLLRSLAAAPSRRSIGRGLAGLALLGPLGARLSLENAAAKKKKRKKCKPKCPSCKTCKKGKCKPKPNGTPCGTGRQCADGTCVVGQGTCPAGENACAGSREPCHETGLCRCFITTAEQTRCGQANSLAACGECVNDGDCRSAYGPGAFCVQSVVGTQGCGCPVDTPNFCRKACDV